MKNNDPIDIYNNLPLLGLLPLLVGFLIGSLIVGRFDALIFSFLLLFSFTSKTKTLLSISSFKKSFIVVVLTSILIVLFMHLYNPAFIWLLLPVAVYWGRKSYIALKTLEGSDGTTNLNT